MAGAQFPRGRRAVLAVAVALALAVLTLPLARGLAGTAPRAPGVTTPVLLVLLGAVLAVLAAAAGLAVLAVLGAATVSAPWRWRAGAAAGAAARRGAQVFQASPVGQVELDLQHRIRQVNGAFAELVGLPPERLVEMEATALFHADSPAPDLVAVAQLLAGTRPRLRGERVLRGPDGTAVPVLVELGAVRQDGAVVGLAGAVTVLTEQIGDHQQLRAARERAEALFARSPVGLIEADRSGRIVRANEALTRMLGYATDELAGTDGLLLHADPQVGRRGLQRLASGTEYAEERRYRRKDGTQMPALVVTAVLRDGAGAPDGYAAFIVDASELVAQREALERREALLASVLETVDVGIIVHWKDGEALRNRAHRAFYGLPEQDAASSLTGVDPLVDLLGPDGERLAAEQWPVARALRGEDVGVVPMQVGPRGGPHREVVTRTRLMTDEHGAVLGAVLAMTDVSELARTARELARERGLLEQAQRVGRLGSFSYLPQQDRWWFSPQLLALWGHEQVLAWAQLRLGIVEQDRPSAAAALQQALAQGGRHETAFRIRRAPDGEQRWLRAVVEVEHDAQGRAVLVTGTHQDVTDQTRAEQALVDERRRLSAILTSSPDFTYVQDLRTRRLSFTNDRRIAGHDPAERRQTPPERLYDQVHPEDLAPLRAADVAVLGLDDGQHVQVRFRLRGTDGSWHWIRRHTTPFSRDPQTGQVVEVLGVGRDVSDVVATEERLSHAATHDTLTGLPNRARLADRLQESLGRAQRGGGRVGVVYGDLDGFKAVNDTAGHAAGDAVLVQVAKRLRATARSDALVARVGGDEFVVVVDDLGGDADVVLAALADRLAQVVAQPVTVDGTDHRVAASLGLAVSRPGETPEALLERADAAMYAGKRDRKQRAVGLPVQPGEARTLVAPE